MVFPNIGCQIKLYLLNFKLKKRRETIKCEGKHSYNFWHQTIKIPKDLRKQKDIIQEPSLPNLLYFQTI
jgi:hypothetical protein